MVGTSVRRFDAGSVTHPIFQFVAMTLPILLLLVWFLIDAHWRPSSECYTENDPQSTDEARINACSKLIPLKQYVAVYLVAECAWMMLAVYLSVYIPRRHALVDTYLTQGELVIGDIQYNRPKRGIDTLTSHGHVVYTLPDSTAIRRRVFLYERYTRERAAILCLPDMPYSGQSKLDLEIDRDVIEKNRSRLEFLNYCAWAWTTFCAIAPLYIVHVLKKFENGSDAAEMNWKPDVNEGSFIVWYYILAFAMIPAVASLSNWVAWLRYKHWMTSQYSVHRDGEPRNVVSRGLCCFDDEECESIDMVNYTPPSADAANSRWGKPVVAHC
jgi:hypothetical protein